MSSRYFERSAVLFRATRWASLASAHTRRLAAHGVPRAVALGRGVQQRPATSLVPAAAGPGGSAVATTGPGSPLMVRGWEVHRR